MPNANPPENADDDDDDAPVVVGAKENALAAAGALVANAEAADGADTDDADDEGKAEPEPPNALTGAVAFAFDSDANENVDAALGGTLAVTAAVGLSAAVALREWHTRDGRKDESGEGC